MDPFVLHPDFYNRPIRLTEEEMANAPEVLRRFFAGTSLSETRGLLWKMVEACVGHPNEMAFETPDLRQNVLLLYYDLERALEAAWLLCGRKENKSPEKP
jgi:hypothetical protein